MQRSAILPYFCEEPVYHRVLKQIAAFLLSLLMLTESLLPKSVGIEQSLHVSQILAHFQEHKLESKQTLGFWKFLEMHYSADSNHTKEKKHHIPSLDFQSVTVCFVIPSFSVEFLHVFPAMNDESPNFHWLDLYDFLATTSLIFPPRA